MKKAFFVTHPDLVRETNLNPWKNYKYNSKSIELPAGNGLLTVRRRFACTKPVKSAVIRATALGIFDLRLNGSRVGEKTENGTVYDELKPGWTDYRFRVFQFTYDVTEQIKAENCLIATVSSGWWSGKISFGFYGYCRQAFCGEIEIVYRDGSSELIASGDDGSWEASVCGPALTAEIWDGEYYDARLPLPESEKESYTWITAEKSGDFKGKIIEPEGPPIRVRRNLCRRPQSAVVHKGSDSDGSEFGSIHVLARRDGEGCEKGLLKAGENMILDMGQNMVGRPKITLRASEGTVIKVFFAEFLNDSGESSRGNDGPRGSMYIMNYRSALSRVVYIASGKGMEEYHPTFSFYGFRYLEITAEGDVEILETEGELIGSDMEETAFLETSNPEVNRLISNVMWSQRANYLSVPTDCPQRDERLGWMGDAALFCCTGAYQMYTRDFMRKWMQDVRDSQEGYDGAYCDVAPRVFTAGNHTGIAAWADAGIIVPYHMYMMYNDTELLREHYDSMERYMEHTAKNGLKGPAPRFGDWLSYEATDVNFISVCYYAYDARLMALYSGILGKNDREEYYLSLKKSIDEEFRRVYMEGDDLTVRTQTSYLMALKFGLVPEDLREKFIGRLREKIVGNGYTLSTGILGTGMLNQTLSEIGLDDLCYSLLLQTRDPSWLYSVRQGATTVWERWNSYTTATGFGKVTMNSFNHYAYGAVLEWMYKKAAGISPDPEHPGFSHFILCPTPDTRKGDSLPEGQSPITYVKAGYKSVCGLIRSGWTLENGQFVFSATIPAGTSARVEFPLLNGTDEISVNGVNVSSADLGGHIENGRMIFELSSGDYVIK